MATNYLALRSSAAVNLTISTLTGSTITAPTATVSTLMGSTLSGLTMTLSTLTGSTITVSTLFGSTITGSTITASSIIARGLVLSTLTVSSINNAVPGTGAGISAFSTLTVSSLVSVSSIQTASTMYTSSMITTGNVGIGTTAPTFTFDVASSTQNIADVNVLSNTTYGSFGQTWTTISGPPTVKWNGVALSATGQYQTAVYGNYSEVGGVYYSHNYGVTWAAGSIPASQHYVSVAMSASGQYQVTAVNGNGGKIYVSTDYGVTWTIVASSFNGLWTGLCMSATGQYMTGVTYYYSTFLSYIYYSNDYGVTWSIGTGPTTSLYMVNVCCSGSGQYQTASINGSGLWYSSNYGVSWTLSTSSGARVWVGACCSLSGQYQSACVLNGSIYYSSDYGVTWTSSGVANAAWQDICCDSTAQYQLCTVSTGKVWYSTNYGQSWTISTSATATWSRPRMSRYGQYSLAAINNGTLASSNLSSVNQPFLRLGCGSSGNQAGIILNTWNARPGGPSCQIMSMDDGGFSSHLAFFSAASGSAGYTVSTERMRITANGSVGIGTNTPAANVHVYDPTASSSAVPLMVLSPNISAGGAQYLYFGTANSSNNTAQLGWYNVGAGSASNYAFLQIFGKANIMTWQASTGYVGIGTTNPGDILSLYSSSNLSFRISNTNAGYYQVGLANAGGQYSSHAVAGDSVVRAVSGNLILQTGSGSSGVYINSSNNVGIGTAAPVAILDLYGSFRILNKPYVALTSGTGIEFVYDAGGNMTSGTRAAGGALTTANMNYAAASHNFYIGPQAATSAMFIGTTGNVGIGTATPVGQLSVVLNGTAVGNTGTWGAGHVVFGPGAGSTTGSGLGITYNTAGNYGALISLTPGIAWRDMYYYANSHNFYYGASALMTILSSGNVGIGTANPTSLLQVAGAINCTSFLVNGVAVATGTGSVWGVSGSVAYYTSGQVGIGTTVTQNNMLRVFGGNSNSGISLGDFQGTAGIKYIGLTAESNGTIVDTSSGFAGITWGPARDGGTSSYMAFHTHGYGVSSGERMRIDKAGLVGISTNTPITNLHVRVPTFSTPVLIVDAGTQGADSTSVPRGIGKPLIGVGANSWSNISSGDYYGIGFGYNGNNNPTLYYPAEIGFLTQTTAGGEYGDMVFSTRPTTTATTIASERMRITSAGNIGIGTTSPSAALQVSSSSSTYGMFRLVNSTATTSNEVSMGYFNNPGASYSGATGSAWAHGIAAYGVGANNFGLGCVGTNLIMSILSSGRVGIGTATPGAPLTIYTSSNQPVSITSTSSDANIQFNCTSTGGRNWYAGSAGLSSGSGAGNFYIYDGTAGSTRMVINSSGSVGIGTASPSDILHLYTSGATANMGIITQNGTRIWRAGVRGDTSSSYVIQDDTASAMRLVIDSNGYVGIGTASPAASLQITQTSAAGSGYGSLLVDSPNSGSAGGCITIRNSAGGTNAFASLIFEVDGSTSCTSSSTPTGFAQGNGMIYCLCQGVGAGNAGKMGFIQWNGSAEVETMTLLPSGNVGIGTASPTSLLHMYSTAGASTTATLTITNGANSNNNYGSQIVFSNIAGGTGVTLPLGSIACLRENNAANYSSYFAFSLGNIQGNGSTYEVMRINSSGNLGIGTNAPNFQLHLYKDSPGILFTSTSYLSNPWYLFVGTSNGAMYLGPNTGTGTPGCNVAIGASAWAATSDARLKKSITPLPSALDNILQLNPILFQYKTDSDSETLREGFIAQEVRSIFPSKWIVNETGMPEQQVDDNGELYDALSLSTTQLIPHLVKSIQELSNIVTSSVSQIQELSQTVTSSVSQIQELSQTVTSSVSQIQDLSSQNTKLQAQLDAVLARLSAAGI